LPPGVPPSRANACALQLALVVGLLGFPLPAKNGIGVGFALKS